MQPLLMPLMVVALAAFSWLAWKRLPVAVALVLLLLPSYQLRFSLGGISLAALEGCVLIVGAVWLIRFWQGKERFPGQSPYHWPTLLFLGSATASLLVTEDIRSGLGLWRAYVAEPILYILVFWSVASRDSRTLRFAKLSLGALTLIIGLWSAWQALGLVPSPSPWNTQLPPRFSSLFDYPNAVGLFLAPVLAFFLAKMLLVSWKDRRLHEWRFLIGVFTFGLFAVGASVSEGAFLGIAAALVFILLFHRKRRMIFLSLVLVAVALLAIPLVRGYVGELVTFSDTSGDVRLRMWQGTWRLLQDHPIEGAGLGGFPILYDQYRDAAHVELLLYPHNVFLNFWVETGLLGLIAFLSIIALFFFRVYRAYHRAATAHERAAAVGFGAAMVALLAHGLVDVPYFKNDLAILFWFIILLPEMGAGRTNTPFKVSVPRFDRQEH